jgi:hypothetical protein
MTPLTPLLRPARLRRAPCPLALALLCLFALALALLAAPPAQADPPVPTHYTPINVPVSLATGINNRGGVVGSYYNNIIELGFLYDAVAQSAGVSSEEFRYNQESDYRLL